MSFTEIVEIPLCEITVSDLNVRETHQNQDIDELAASIKEHGLLQPVVLRGVNGKPPYELIAGQRRFLAHEKLNRKKIPAVFAGSIDDTKALLLSLIENLQTVDLSHADTAKAITTLYDHYEKDERKVHKATGLALRTIRDYLKIESLASPKMKEMLKVGYATKADVKRAIQAASGEMSKAEQLLELMNDHTLTKHVKKRIVEYGEAHPRVSAKSIIEHALEPRVEATMMVRLPEEVRQGLQQATEQLDQEAEDIVTDVLKKWLSEQGFINYA